MKQGGGKINGTARLALYLEEEMKRGKGNSSGARELERWKGKGRGWKRGKGTGNEVGEVEMGLERWKRGKRAGGGGKGTGKGAINLKREKGS